MCFLLVLAFIFGDYASVRASTKMMNPSITLDKSVYVLKKGKSIKLKSSLNKLEKKKKVIWVGSNIKVTSVSENGRIIEKRLFRQQSQQEFKGQKKAVCKIIVGTPVKSIQLNQ